MSEIALAFYNSPFGIMKICYENDELVSLSTTNEDFEKTKDTDFSIKIKTQLDEYFKGKLKVFDIKLAPKGTQFQKKVWLELSKIPYGETRSYKDIAKSVGNENACRAVGMANNKNPIMIIIPCHRVIGTNDELTGYASGLEIKSKLLKLENISLKNL